MEKNITHFYDEIVYLADEIGNMELPERFLEVAKKRDEMAIGVTLAVFQLDQPGLWTRIFKLYEDYVKAGKPRIFGKKKKEEYYMYDSNRINPINLCFLFMFSRYDMSSWDVFGEDSDFFANTLFEFGYVELANLAKIGVIGSLEENLMEAFQ